VVFSLPIPDNQLKTKLVESIIAVCLDAGSTPAISTKTL